MSTNPVIAGYSDLHEIGTGGFSRVYDAFEDRFNRRVAAKVLNIDLVDKKAVAVFERECRAMGALSTHPNIVTVFGSAFSEDGRPCIIMDLYRGGTYMDAVRKGPIAPSELMPLAVKIAGALHTAHSHGVLHRDVKPQNIFKSEFGEPALGDFGISTIGNERSATSTGGLTIHYAPPEVIEGAEASARSDLYSLATSLFTLATGSRPFSASTGSNSVADLALRVITQETPRLPAGLYPSSFSDLLHWSMAKSPDDRPKDMLEFAAAVNRIESEIGLPVTQCPVRTIDEEDLTIDAAAIKELSDDRQSTVTVVRPRAATTAAPHGDEEAAAATPTDAPRQRSWTAAAIAVAALAALAGAVVLVLGSGGSDPQTTNTTGLPSTTADAFFDTVDPVENLQGTISNGEARFTWDEPADGEINWLVERRDTNRASTATRLTQPSITYTVDADEIPCVEVTAFNPSTGRTSRPSEVVCADTGTSP